MRTLAIDESTGDLGAWAGRLVTYDGADAIRQRLAVRLRLWQGEWFADTSVGIPYLRFLGAKGTEALAESVLQQAILTAPGVLALDSFRFALDARRRASVTFRARLATGDVLEVRDFVAGAA